MIDSPNMTQAHSTRRLLAAGGGVVVAALAGGAFVSTFDTLRALAVRGGVSRHYAFLYPWMLDGLVVVVILSILMSRRSHWASRAVRWLLLLVLAAGAATAGVQYAVRGYDRLPHTWVSGGVAVAPWVILLLAFWLWASMIKQVRRPQPVEPPPVQATDLIPGLADEPRPLPPPPALPELTPVREDRAEPARETPLPVPETPSPAPETPPEAPLPVPEARLPVPEAPLPVPEAPLPVPEPLRAQEAPLPVPEAAEEPGPVARTLLPTDVPLVGMAGDTKPDGIKLPDTRPDGIPLFESGEDDDAPDRAEDPDVMPEENVDPPFGKVRSSPTPPRD